MADISKIKLPSGTEYDIKDAWARTQIEAITGGSAIVFKGVSTTPLTDGGTEKPTVGGEVIQAVSTGDLYFYGTDEFIWNAGGTWSALGPTLTVLGDLAYADTASASYTPAGSISGATFTGSSSDVTVTVVDDSSSTGNYTPAGSITGTAFTGASMTSTGKFTPSGSVSLTNTNKTATVSAAVSGTTTYTPAGSVAAPTISVKTAGTTTTIKNPTKATVTTAVVAAAPNATAPDNAITYYNVTDETLTLYKIGYTTGDSITTSDVTVKTGDAAYESSAPGFTGTAVRLVTDNIAVPSSASFSGEEGNVSVSGTTTGSVSNGTFSGTKVKISGTTTAQGSVTGGTFSGTSATITVSPDND